MVPPDSGADGAIAFRSVHLRPASVAACPPLALTQDQKKIMLYSAHRSRGRPNLRLRHDHVPLHSSCPLYSIVCSFVWHS